MSPMEGLALGRIVHVRFTIKETEIKRVVPAIITKVIDKDRGEITVTLFQETSTLAGYDCTYSTCELTDGWFWPNRY